MTETRKVILREVKFAQNLEGANMYFLCSKEAFLCYIFDEHLKNKDLKDFNDSIQTVINLRII